MMNNSSRRYYRIMLGAKSTHAEQCIKDNYIGCNFPPLRDLSKELASNLTDFNKNFMPEYLTERPDKSKVAAGLAGGSVHRIGKEIKLDDVVLCPDTSNRIWLGKVVGNYLYREGKALPHSREVKWMDVYVNRKDLSNELQNSIGAPLKVIAINDHAPEIEALIQGSKRNLYSTDESVKNPLAFAMEAHLKDFLLKN